MKRVGILVGIVLMVLTAALFVNRLNGVNVEIEVRSDSRKASFVAGPINPTNGIHINPFLSDGVSLRLFEALDNGSDTRRNPDAAKEWHRGKGRWSESEAVAETLRLAQALGHPTNSVSRHTAVALPISVRDPFGADVEVTPFYKVDLYTADGSRLLGVEYRMGETPPGKVSRWFNWPPIKIH